MLVQEAGEGGIGGKVGLVGEKGRVVRQHDLEVGRIPAEQADELGFGSVGVRLCGHGRAGCARAAVVSTAASKIRDKFTPGNTPDRPSG